MRRRDERGGGTILVLVLVAVLGALAVGGSVVGGVLVGQRRAAAAADLAALAAAEQLGVAGGSAADAGRACEAADRVGGANDARLTGCLVEGLEVVVEVEVDVAGVLGAGWSVPGRARAGPSGEVAPAPTTASGGPAP